MERVLLEEKVNTTSKDMLEKICEQYIPPKISADIEEVFTGALYLFMGACWTGIAIGINHNAKYDGGVGHNIGTFLLTQLIASPFWISGLGVGLGGITTIIGDVVEFVKLSPPRKKDGKFYYREGQLTDLTNIFERSKSKIVYPLEDPAEVMNLKGSHVFMDPVELRDAKFTLQPSSSFSSLNYSVEGRLAFKDAEFSFRGNSSEPSLDRYMKELGAPGCALCYVRPDDTLWLRPYRFKENWRPSLY